MPEASRKRNLHYKPKHFITDEQKKTYRKDNINSRRDAVLLTD